MDHKKEIQEKIIKENSKKIANEEFSSILKLVAPGTNLRSALDGALKAGRGALIVVENENLIQIIDGGFRLNTRLTPQRVIELCKMDGAIVLSKDMKKINYANVLLTPDSKITTFETGSRHKTAERTAKQAATLVIAISERKHEINVFYKKIKYHLINTDELLRKANENIQILEKQRELFDKNVEKLNLLELRNYQSLNQAVQTIQKGSLIQKIAENLKRYVLELGKEGTLLKIRLKELVKDVEKETDLIIKDYTQINLKRSKTLIETLTYDEILDSEHLLRILGYDKSTPQPISVGGWRILSKTSLLEVEIAQLISEAGSLGKSIHSNLEFYKKIIGDAKATILKEELNRLKMNNLNGL